MRIFFASLFKDLKLFLRGAGLPAIILPLVLVPALVLGSSMEAGPAVRPFPIAVRDEDGTVMSRSLISQLEEIELFSQVRVLGPGETDGEAIASGAAAVAVIPHDFFFDLYDMRECPVTVTLSSSDKVGSAVFEAVFTSVMGMIRANHSVYLSVYRFACGDLTPELIRDLQARAGESLLTDALGRGRVFSDSADAPDLTGALNRRVSACVLWLLASLFALTALRTVPEERRLGVIPRLTALGAGRAVFPLSKLVSVLALSLPAVVLVSVLVGSFPYTFCLYAALLAVSMAFLWPLTALRSPAGMSRWGNMLILLSLALSGTVWPVPLALARLSPGYYARLALDARAMGLGLPDTLALIWPLALFGLIGAVISAFVGRGWFRSFSIHKNRSNSDRSASVEVAPDAFPALKLSVRRFWRISDRSAPGEGASGSPPGTFPALRLSERRFWHISGGAAGLAATAVVAFVCGLVSAGAAESGAIKLAVTDLDGSALSRELIDDLSNSPGVEVAVIDEADADALLLTGGAEGVLCIPSGYGERLLAQEMPGLTYKSSPASFSARGVRETAAGLTVSQQRSLEAPSLAAALLGRDLTADEQAELQRLIRDTADNLPPLYRLRYTGGTQTEPWSPDPMAFASLAALFTLLTAACFLQSADGRAVSRRLASLPHGRRLGFATELIPMTLLGALTLTAALLPRGLKPIDILAVPLTSLCLASLSLLITSLTQREGRMDALAPLLALLICLLGGSFIDLATVSPTLGAITLISPAGLASAARGGDIIACAAMGGGSAMLAGGYYSTRRG